MCDSAVYTLYCLYKLCVQHYFNGPLPGLSTHTSCHPQCTYTKPSICKLLLSNIYSMHVRVHNISKYGSRRHGSHPHAHPNTRFSNFGPKCGALNGHQPLSRWVPCGSTSGSARSRSDMSGSSSDITTRVFHFFCD